jgi:hypothetical protein
VAVLPKVVLVWVAVAAILAPHALPCWAAPVVAAHRRHVAQAKFFRV